MPFQPEEGNNEGGAVLFQKNWDKDAQHELEITSTLVMESITGYMKNIGLIEITDAEAVSLISAKLSRIIHIADMLYVKYHKEKYKEVKDKEGKISGGEYREGYIKLRKFQDELETATSFNGISVKRRLDELIHNELLDVAIPCKLMDKTDSREPWERGVGTKFFPE